MTLNEYQELIKHFRLTTANKTYVLLGLVGEVGELYSKLAKEIRDNKIVDHEDIEKELGDILWFVAALASDFDLKLDKVAHKNIDKLNGRKQRGVLGGSGDNR